MKKNLKDMIIPTLKFNSEYFKCPKCDWTYPGPLKIYGDVASNTRCEKCGNSYLVRIK